MTKDNDMSKMRYLTRRRGGGLALRVSKPQHLCADEKKQIVVRGLGTPDIDIAQPLKWKALAVLHAEWNHETPRGKTLEDELQVAQLHAQTEYPVKYSDDYHVEDFAEDISSGPLSNHLDDIEAKYGPEAAQQWGDIAAGAVPISLAAAQWSEHHKGQLTSGTLDGDKKEHQAFYKWAGDVPVQKVDAALAGKYVRDVLLKQFTPKGTAPAPATVRRKISSMSKLFKWVSLSGVCPMLNPFDGLNALVKGGKERGGTAGKRAFTKVEMRVIFEYVRENKKGDELKLQEDALMLLAFTGVRYRAILSLTKDQVTKEGSTYWLDIRDDKSSAGKRAVPVVAAVAKAILKKRLSEGEGEYVFPEYAESTKDGKGSDAIGKRLRRSVYAALPKAEGFVDLHSYRRTMITIGDEQGVEINDLSRLVGHTLPAFTLRQYSSSMGKERLMKTAKVISKEIERWIL